MRDPTVRETLSIYLVNSLYDNVDVANALGQEAAAQRQGPRRACRGGPAAARDQLGRVPAGQASSGAPLRERASAHAHQRLINVLANKTGSGISTGNGVVSLNLGELVTQLGGDLGLPDAALAQPPPMRARSP